MSVPPRRHGADRAPIDAPPWRRRATPAAPRDVAAPRFIGDRAMIELRQQLALEPEAVPQPVDLDGGVAVDRLAVRVCAIVAVAALVAWGVVSFSHARLPDREARQARVVPATAPIKLADAHAAAARPSPAPTEEHAVAEVAFAAEEKTPAWASAAPLPLLLQQAGVSIAVKAPEPAPAAASPASAAAIKPGLSADEIATLVNRGKAFMTDGDVVAARLLLQRAAEAGNADAALALGASFDPVIIKQARAIGVQTDAAQARYWYQKAAALGSQVAAKQLAELASAGQ